MGIKYLGRLCSLGYSASIFYILNAMSHSFPRISRAQFASCQQLTQKKYRQRQRKFLVEGAHLVAEALDSDWPVELVMVTEAFQHKKDFTTIIEQTARHRIDVCELSEREAGKLSETVTSQGVLAVIGMKEVGLDTLWEKKSDASVLVALEAISDPGNVGTILRTCDWFGIDAVLMDTETVELYNPKVIRSSMGAVFHLPIVVDVDLRRIVQEAKDSGASIIVTVVQGGSSPIDIHPKKSSLIIFGSEAHGVSPEIRRLADSTLTIPRFGKAESLNVGAAAAIVLAALKLRNEK